MPARIPAYRSEEGGSECLLVAHLLEDTVIGAVATNRRQAVVELVQELFAVGHGARHHDVQAALFERQIEEKEFVDILALLLGDVADVFEAPGDEVDTPGVQFAHVQG